MGVREIYSNFCLVFDFCIIFTVLVLQGSRKLVKGQAGDISGKNASNGRLPDRPFEDKDADFSSASLISKKSIF